MKRKNLLKLIGTIFILITIPLAVFLTQKVVNYFSGASEVPANLVIDLKSNNPASNDNWRNLAQGGEDKGRQLLPVITQLKTLRPEYIRIDHVFDYYDQGQLDLIISDITSVGAKPFISLSYMPPSISRSGSITDIPANWLEWEKKVQNIIEHVSGKGGLNISGVYYEVWNEPDLFGGFKVSGSKNYLDLYLHSAIGQSRAGNTNPYKFGGPATTGYYENWMKSLLNFTSKNHLRMDFLSWHKYSKRLDDYIGDANKQRELFQFYNLNNIEMIVSELGPNSENDPVYDNNFSAIHQIAVSTVLQDSISRSFAFEIKDGAGEKQYWGRWGLYTNEKFGTPVEKPRAKAIKFLNNMAGAKL